MVYKTVYINKYFQAGLDDNTKLHIFLNNLKLATINNDNSPYYILGDHLNSSSVLVDDQGGVAEYRDYKPFGGDSYVNQISDLDNSYLFTGKEKDQETGLQYYGARYLDNEVGKFISIDNISLNLHDPEQLKNLSNQELQGILSNPQFLNSYSYSANNPVVYTDPDGNFLDTFLDIGFIAYDVYKIAQSYAQTGKADQEYVKALGLDSVGLLIPGATGLGMVGRVANKADNIADVAKLVKKADNVVGASNSAFTPLKGMHIVTGAQKKLDYVSSVTGKSVDDIIERASKSNLRFIDNANNGNINIFIKNTDRGNDFIRVTLDPDKQKIISSGFNEYNNVMNNIQKGRLKRIDY